MSAPVRIQLSRRKGFRLQEVSLALNGLPAVKVDRTTRWGNQIVVGEERGIGWHPWTAEDAVAQFRDDIEYEISEKPSGEMPLDLSPLRNKNLACWCALDAPFCHADVLLSISNRLICETVHAK